MPEVTVRPWERAHLISAYGNGRNCPLLGLAVHFCNQRKPRKEFVETTQSWEVDSVAGETQRP